jgi:peptidoglycan hydrolase-like protein with peptidoglycan-binding domain
MKLKRVLMLRMSGDDVKLLQTRLKELGFYKERIDGYFGQNTLVAVTNFQRVIGTKPDGVVGSLTWSNVLVYDPKKKDNSEVITNDVKEISYNVSYIGEDGLKIYDCLLEKDEYYNKKTQKNTIWLHHTAGGSRPDWTIGGWEKDFQKDENGNPILDEEGNIKPLKVGTHFVIGRKSSSSSEIIWDGKVLKAIDDKFWAYHLGINGSKSEELNSKSITIEICNYGPLTLGKDNVFYNYVNKPVNNEDVVELEKPFKGYKYWEKYTESQLESLKKLIIYLQNKWKIEIETGIYNEDWFNYDDKWFTTGGLRTHTQVRKDKFDLSPQPELIKMLNSL